MFGVFSYFDLVNKKVVVVGPPIEMMVNVIVFNGEMGKLLVGVLVILGNDFIINEQCIIDD